MTRKIYKSAMGRTVDLGALILENENVRAVGNMNVNARGDVLDSGNQVIDPKTRQVHRQYKRQSKVAVASENVSTSTVAAKKRREDQTNIGSRKKAPKEIIDTEIEDTPVINEPEVKVEANAETPKPRGGLAAAIAKSQMVKQELLKTPRQLAQESGIKKI